MIKKYHENENKKSIVMIMMMNITLIRLNIKK